MIVGLKNGDIVVIGEDKKQNIIMQSHSEGETWGLEVIHLEGGEIRVLTSADDNRILAYDLTKRGNLAEGKVCVEVDTKTKKKKKKAAPKVRGASSMSTLPAQCQSRCLAYLDSKKHLAVAQNTGLVTIRQVDWDLVDKGDNDGLNKVIHKLFTKLAKAEWIEFMSYSPNGQFLGVGSHDNHIYLMNTNKNYQ